LLPARAFNYQQSFSLGWINNHYNHGSTHHNFATHYNYGSGDNNNMDNHNFIHDYNDEHYYYCTLYDCACNNRTNYYDTSNNLHIPTRANNARPASNGSATTNIAASHPRDSAPSARD